MINTLNKDSLLELPLLPLKNIVLFPKSIVPVVIGRLSSIKSVEYALATDSREICIVTQKKHQDENPILEELYHVATHAIILQAMKMPKGNYKLLLEGISRLKIDSIESKEDIVFVTASQSETIFPEDNIEFKALWKALQETYTNYTFYYDKMPQHLLSEDVTVYDAEIMIDTLITQLTFDIHQKQLFLEEKKLYNRIQKILLFLKTELDILNTEERIKNTIQSQIESTQREYYLHEQLKAIQKELKKDKTDDIIHEYRKKMNSLNLSLEAKDKIDKEITRLEGMQAFSSEASVNRHYIEWVLSLPWEKLSKDTHSLIKAKSILDKDHYGLVKIKERILEFIAAKKYSTKLIKTPVLCLVGPPGVGKTSLVLSIANSLNRELVKVALGGVKDESEIRGHRRTYVASMPGRILQGMKKANTVNPVFLLDEIDKMSNDLHGDPASALLEVLDPEQNKEFVDNYLEISYDLSQVIFIATANHIDGIPYALADRMEMIFLSGYTNNEKMEISKKFLLPKLLRDHNLNDSVCIFQEEALAVLINEYTREAGIRNLERLITRSLRKIIQEILEFKPKKAIIVDRKKIINYFKSSPYKMKAFDHSSKIGIVTGLAWTELGGEVLEVEVAFSKGKGNLTLTGQLGEVMQESAQTALSYIKFKSDLLQIKKNFFNEHDIHIHVPEGATPKDGPSAGITICTALVSALKKIPVKPLIAMTGEITLQGRVLSVGGLKEKFLAAHSYGFKEIIVPAEHKDYALESLEELGKEVVSLYFVETMDEVLMHGLIKNPFEKTKKIITLKVSSSRKRKESI